MTTFGPFFRIGELTRHQEAGNKYMANIKLMMIQDSILPSKFFEIVAHLGSCAVAMPVAMPSNKSQQVSKSMKPNLAARRVTLLWFCPHNP